MSFFVAVYFDDRWAGKFNFRFSLWFGKWKEGKGAIGPKLYDNVY